MPRKITFSDDDSTNVASSSKLTSSVDASAPIAKPAATNELRSSQKKRDGTLSMEDDNEDDDDDDDAPVEESLTTSASTAADREKQARQQRKEANLKRKRAEEARAAAKRAKVQKKAASPKAQSKEPEGSDHGVSEDEDEDSKDDEESLSAPSSSRIDPALFAKAFARQAALAAEDDAKSKSKGPAKSALKKGGRKGKEPETASKMTSDPVEARQRAARRQKLADRRDGIVRGNDGRPMKRLDDGRTVIRALPKLAPQSIKFDDDESTAEDEKSGAKAPVVEEGLAYEDGSYDTLQARPNANARAFLKRKLKRKGGVLDAQEDPSASKGKKASGPKKTFDDPLGLEDPFLMKGGAYASEEGHKRLTGAPVRKTGKLSMKSSRRSGGGRIGAAANNRSNVVGASAYGSFARSLL